MRHFVGQAKGVVPDLEGGGDKCAHGQSCMLLRTVESKRGNGLIADCTAIALLRVRSHLTL